MKPSFQDQLMEKIHCSVKKRLKFIFEQQDQQMMSESISQENVLNTKGTIANSSLNSPLKLSSMFKKSNIQNIPGAYMSPISSPFGNRGGMDTFNKLTATPQINNSLQDENKQAENDLPFKKSIVVENRRYDSIWEESISKKKAVIQRVISRARRRSKL